MFKNMIRKSLALGAGVALAASGLVAAPAQATATGLLWSAYGQTNEMVGVAGHLFTLRVGNPAAISATTGTDQLTDIADQVKVTMVENANVATITPTVEAKMAMDTAVSGNTIAVQVDAINREDGDQTAVTTGELASAEGLIEIAPPATLTHSIQVEVQVTYDDGSKSEVERITFLPAKSVSAAISLSPVVVGGTARAGSFSFNGINTGNFISSNFTVQDGAQAAGATAIDINVTQDDVAVVATVGTYDPITDSQPFTYAATIASADILIAGLTINDVEINKYFDSALTAADRAEAKFTVGTTDANAALKISALGTNVVHNSTGTDTSLVDANTVVAPEGTKSLNFVIQALTGTNSTTAAGANIPITVSLRDDVAPVNGLETTTISSNGKTLDISGSTVSFTLLTNSSGQVAFTVTADNAKDGESFTIDATNSIGDSISQTTVRWEEAAWTLIPAIDGNFTIAPKGSVAVDYTVIDQFGTLAGADYQIAFTRAPAAGPRTAAQRANWSYVAPVSATGRASVTIVDNGAAATEGKDTVTATLQKAATAGGAYLAVAGSTDTFVLNYKNNLSALTSTAKVNYNGIKNSSGTAIAPIYLETDPLVNYDSRLSTDRTAVNKWSQFNYDAGGVVVAGTNSADAQLRVFGTVVTTNNAPVSGVAVKLSAAGLNFADNAATGTMTRASNDSFVVFTDATGSYEAFVRGATTGNVTIAVDAQGATSSVEVRFESSTGVATGLTLVGPSSVASGARADFVATVVDKFGKPVSGVDVTFKDNGPGVLNTTAAVSTDAFGEAQATLTTLAAERGTTVVTAYATIGGVLVTQTATITVGASAASADGKVNVGSFNGKLVVYALGLDGAKISWKVAGRWGTAVASGDALNRFDRPVGAAGRNVIVEIYVNGVRQLQKTVLTR
jgi:hypothetical protein